MSQKTNVGIMCLTLFALVMGPHSVWAEITPEKLAYYRKGKTDTQLEETETKGRKKATTVGLMNAPLEVVWSVLLDFKAYPEFVPRMSWLKTIGMGPQYVINHSYLDMPWPLSDVAYQAKVAWQKEKRELSFEMIPGSGKGVSMFEGKWKLTKISPQETLAAYEVVFVPEKWFPRWAINLGMKSSIGKTLKAFEDRAIEVGARPTQDPPAAEK